MVDIFCNYFVVTFLQNTCSCNEKLLLSSHSFTIEVFYVTGNVGVQFIMICVQQLSELYPNTLAIVGNGVYRIRNEG